MADARNPIGVVKTRDTADFDRLVAQIQREGDRRADRHRIEPLIIHQHVSNMTTVLALNGYALTPAAIKHISG